MEAKKNWEIKRTKYVHPTTNDSCPLSCPINNRGGREVNQNQDLGSQNKGRLSHREKAVRIFDRKKPRLAGNGLQLLVREQAQLRVGKRAKPNCVWERAFKAITAHCTTYTLGSQNTMQIQLRLLYLRFIS